MNDDGTSRHGTGLPGCSYERIVAPPPDGATGLIISLDDAAPQQSSIQRDKPQQTAIVAKVNARQNFFGEPHATHTPSQAGRALPGRNRCSASDKLDAYQNISHAQAATGSASGTAGSDGVPRSAPDLGQRAQPLADAPRPPRKSYVPGVV